MGKSVDRARAVKLREEGFKYADIAKQLGCSVDWCKANLKSVKKHKTDDEILAQVVWKAKSKDGITNNEIRHIIKTLHKNTFIEDDKTNEDKIFSRIKVKLSKEEDCLVRPSWLVPDRARECLNAILMAKERLDKEVEEQKIKYKSKFNLDDTYDNSISWAIISLTDGGGSLIPNFGVNYTKEKLKSITDSFVERNKT